MLTVGGLVFQRAAGTMTCMSSSNYRNRLRIIGGEWRSRVVVFADAPDLRPTPDRVRETLFNWLQPRLAGAKCLDLFAGSGVLGFEALSRGAGSVTALELDINAVAAIRANIKTLQAENFRLEPRNALEWLRSNAQQQRFDVVFLDPPFAENQYEECCRLLAEQQWLAPGALVYLESGASLDAIALPQGWELIRHKRAGAVHYGLAQPSL
jgi:16S rRNA (guanine966-N2)-methyltransferase